MHITDAHPFWDDVYLCRERSGEGGLQLFIAIYFKICSEANVPKWWGVKSLFSFLYVYLTYFLLKFIIKNFIDVQIKEQKEKEGMKKTGSLTTTAGWPWLQEVSVQYGIKCTVILCHPLPVSSPRHWVQIILLKLQIN